MKQDFTALQRYQSNNRFILASVNRAALLLSSLCVYVSNLSGKCQCNALPNDVTLRCGKRWARFNSFAGRPCFFFVCVEMKDGAHFLMQCFCWSEHNLSLGVFHLPWAKCITNHDMWISLMLATSHLRMILKHIKPKTTFAKSNLSEMQSKKKETRNVQESRDQGVWGGGEERQV